MRKVTYSVPNIACHNCVQTIKRGLDMTGIHKVEVDVAKKIVAVEYDSEKITDEAVHSQLERAGFPPAGMFDASEIQQEVDGKIGAAEERQEEKKTQPVWFWIISLGVVIFAAAGYLGYVLYPRFGLPAVEGASLMLLATGAGIASFFSPCSFPLLVTLLAQQPGVARGKGNGKETDQSRYPFSFAAALSIGAALFLILGGLVISLGGEALFAGVVFDSPAGRIIRTVVGTALILLGLMQLGVLPFSLHSVEHISRPLMRSQARYRRDRPFLGFILFGFGYLLAGFG